MKKTSLLIAVVALMLPIMGVFAATKAPVTGVININNAPAEELMKLPGIGKAKAEAIITYRQAHPFKAVSELTEVKGIGPKMLDKLQPHITVDGTVSTPVASSSGIR